ncbi:MAG TPA: IS66 family transposase [Candidatus Omnitrophica bacterium]|nr:IS66 family transposase [Candidatus Omnitrophota bacterium]
MRMGLQDIKNLQEQNKKLVKENERLKRENKQLKDELKKLQKEIKKIQREFEEYKAKYPASDFIPNFIKEPVKHRRRKNGQKKGHKGYTRKIPERVDVVKPLTIEKCPYCGNELSEIQEIRKRYVEDIPEISNTIITEYQIERRYCKHCKKMVEPEIPDVLPNARFGLRLMLLVVFLKIGLALPVEKITFLLKTQYNLSISKGEIIKILKQIAKAFGPYYKELKHKIKEVRVKHMDETGWRIDGKNHWLWVLINKEIALYIIRKKRNYEVPAKLLGKQKGKIIISDRLPAYNHLEEHTGCLQQKCWIHILRDSKDLAKHYKEAKIIHKKLKSIYKQAKSYNHKATDKEVNKLLARIDKIAQIEFKHPEVIKFVRSVCIRHRENLFRFTQDVEIDGDNNLAERAIRKAVIIRKISNGNRSKNGAKFLEILLSVIETLKLQGINPFEGMKNIIQTSDK